MAVVSRTLEGVGGLFRDRPRPTPDVVMFILMAGLMALSGIMVYSATFVRLEAEIGDPSAAMRRQFVFAGLALAAFIAGSLFDYRHYRRLLIPIYVSTVFLLVAVLFFPPHQGASRWIPIGPFQFQPSEFAKVALVVVLAAFLAAESERRLKWRRLGLALLLTAIPGFLIFRQPDLARSLRRVADGGPEEFYRGALGREIAEGVAVGGGLLNENDLAGQETAFYEDPPSAQFHGHTVYATGLPSQGALTLELLSLLDGFDLAALGHNTPECIHTMVEAKRLAFADRLAYIGDPEFVRVPLDELLSPEYAERRRRLIDPERSAEIVPAGELAHSAAPTPSTSYFNVIDKDGNAVSFIHSLSAYFGSGFVAGNTGILLNDRAGRGFYLDEGHVNVVAPGKRTINTIHNYMVFKDGRPVLIGGTPGGDNQPQWNAQAISNVIDHGMDVQQAADAPRWTHFPGTDPRSIDEEMTLRMEEGFDEATVRSLEAKGHKIAAYPQTGTPGAVQLIAIDYERGVHAGGTDRRSDGYPTLE